MKFKAALSSSLLAVPASASAAPFAPATPVAGFGEEPALAQIGGVALASGGGSVIVGTADNGGQRRAVAALGDAMSAPAAARGFGPT